MHETYTAIGVVYLMYTCDEKIINICSKMKVIYWKYNAYTIKVVRFLKWEFFGGFLIYRASTSHRSCERNSIHQYVRKKFHRRCTKCHDNFYRTIYHKALYAGNCKFTDSFTPNYRIPFYFNKYNKVKWLKEIDTCLIPKPGRHNFFFQKKHPFFTVYHKVSLRR